jgi:hypothetical protein
MLESSVTSGWAELVVPALLPSGSRTIGAAAIEMAA